MSAVRFYFAFCEDILNIWNFKAVTCQCAAVDLK